MKEQQNFRTVFYSKQKYDVNFTKMVNWCNFVFLQIVITKETKEKYAETSQDTALPAKNNQNILVCINFI